MSKEQIIIRATSQEDANNKLSGFLGDGWLAVQLSGGNGECWILLERNATVSPERSTP